MNILHTSDWHIGKRLMDRERLPEQIEALDELAVICERERVDLVLVAGDVFDTYMPSAEAEEVFFRAVKKLAGSSRAVVIVSGNHDDGVRLAASAPLAAESMAGCSTALMMRCFPLFASACAAPRIAQLSDSVPPEVK